MTSSPDPGILTFLFTDLADSTRLWEQYPEAMQPALARHDALLKHTIEAHGGQLVKTTGDGLLAVFNHPADGVAAALAGQRAMVTEAWPAETGPLQVRMGLHSGESEARDGDFFGPEVNLAARVMGLGYGGQVLLSQATAALTRKNLPSECTLADLGKMRLKGIAALEPIYQLCHPDLPADFPPLQSLAEYKHNLPRQPSTFIGRGKELADVRRLLKDTRLLTLLGPGGTGKTRLMLQAAEELIEDFPDGVWLVELAPLSDPTRISERVAAALNVQEQPGRKILDTLFDYLRRKEPLLLLDNVEHLVRACAEFTEGLLAHCPEITVLVTGREALFINGETTVQIPSLSLPEGSRNTEEIGRSESVQLFLARARAVRPDFKITQQNAPTVAEVVRRLDGIPLALELAAARLRMLTVDQINARLNDRFRLLTGGRRTAIPRQQTLQALIDWSWNLLDEKERVLLRRLSVFSGGWSLESGQSIAGFEPLDEFEVFDLLDQLINKSLVTVEFPPGGEARYDLLESIRQYAQGKLFEAGEGERLHDRLADYFVTFSLEAEKHMRRSSMLPWVERIVQELDNIRSVMTWTLEDRPEIALRISGALLINWPQWLHPSEGFTWLEGAIEGSRQWVEQDPSTDLAVDFIKALQAFGFSQALQGDHKTAVKTMQEGIRMAQEHGFMQQYAQGIAEKTSSLVQHWRAISDDWIQKVEDALIMSREMGFELEYGRLHLVLFTFYVRQGEVEKAIKHLEQGEVVARKYNNPRSLATLLIAKARIEQFGGNLSEAAPLLRQAIEAFAAINDQRLELISRSDLSHVLRRSGKIEEALSIYRETILKWQEQGNPVAVAHQLECIAFMAISRGKFENAARLLGSARETREKMDAISANPTEMAELAQAMAQLEGALGETVRDRLLAEGAQMSQDETVLLALQEES